MPTEKDSQLSCSFYDNIFCFKSAKAIQLQHCYDNFLHENNSSKRIFSYPLDNTATSVL